MMYSDHGGGWDGGQWVAMILVMLVFWGVIDAIVVTVMRRPGLHHVGAPLPPPHHDAERILGERFARGEIDDTEYERRRDTLRKGRSES